MKDQHKHISGYRDLTPSEVAVMNRIKAQAVRVGELMQTLAEAPDADQRWVADAKMQLQKGFMSAVRAVAKPTTF